MALLLNPMPTASTRPRASATSGGDPRQPARPPTRGQGTRLARRGFRDRNQHRRRRPETGNHAPTHRQTHSHTPRHARLPRRHWTIHTETLIPQPTHTQLPMCVRSFVRGCELRSERRLPAGPVPSADIGPPRLQGISGSDYGGRAAWPGPFATGMPGWAGPSRVGWPCRGRPGWPSARRPGRP
jgi:hypothetical protein